MSRSAIVAVVSCLAGAGLAYARVIPALPGFALFALGGIAATVMGLATIIGMLRGRQPDLAQLATIVVGMGFAATAVPGFGSPRINDFTTDLESPPQFVRAAADPANAGRDLAYPADFAAQQRDCCADLRAAVLSTSPAEAYETARRAAAEMENWEVVAENQGAGTIEAVATTVVFGFRDDIVIRVQAAVGGGSRVDIRSKSRDGQGDIGANAARIRTFVERVESLG